jgi:hypothetical protein
MREFLIVVLVIGLVFGALVYGVDRYVNYQCNQYEKVTGRTTEYVLFDSCYIQTADGMQRWSEYVARATASEGLKD